MEWAEYDLAPVERFRSRSPNYAYSETRFNQFEAHVQVLNFKHDIHTQVARAAKADHDVVANRICVARKYKIRLFG